MSTAPLELSLLDSAQARAKARRLWELHQRLKSDQIHSAEQEQRAAEAVRETYTWVTEHTQTYNEHWKEEGRPSPYEAFPRDEYFRHLFELFSLEPVVWLEKSRDLMITWGCVAFMTLNAMKVPYCGVLLQTQKEKKAEKMVNYAKCLYRRQPDWLKEAYPLSKPIERFGKLELEFAAGGYVAGIPGGADQIRSYHPWGYLNDESSFQPAAGECYEEAIAAIKGSIIFNSSAGPGWFADVRHDVILLEED